MANEDTGDLFASIQGHLRDTATPPKSVADTAADDALQRADERAGLTERRDEIYAQSDEWDRMNEQEQEAIRRLVAAVNTRLNYQQARPEAVPLTVRTTESEDTTEEKRFVVYEGQPTDQSHLSVAVFAENFITSHAQGNEFGNVRIRFLDRLAKRTGEIRINLTPTIMGSDPASTRRIFLAEENPALTEVYFAEDQTEWDNGGCVVRTYPTTASFERAKRHDRFSRMGMDRLVAVVDTLENGSPNADLMRKGQDRLCERSKTVPVPTKQPLGMSINLPSNLRIDI